MNYLLLLLKIYEIKTLGISYETNWILDIILSEGLLDTLCINIVFRISFAIRNIR